MSDHRNMVGLPGGAVVALRDSHFFALRLLSNLGVSDTHRVGEYLTAQGFVRSSVYATSRLRLERLAMFGLVTAELSGRRRWRITPLGEDKLREWEAK